MGAKQQSGEACLRLIAQYHDCEPGPLADFPQGPIGSPAEVVEAARRLGLYPRLLKRSATSLRATDLPAIAQRLDGSFFIIATKDSDRLLIHDALTTTSDILPLAKLESYCNDSLIVVRSERSLLDGLARFDFTWFLPMLVEYRKWFVQVLVAAFALQIFALSTPLFFQVVMDKVLAHRTLSTLDVLTAVLIVCMLFESTFNLIRTYVLSHTCARIDVQLGAKLFRHMLSLPLSYFQSRRTGDTVSRLRELETVREFLSGQGIATLMDLLFFSVFMVLLFGYSVTLAWVVMASLPLYILVAWIVTPVLRRRLDVSVARSAEQQALLLETLRGIDTVKAMAIEPQIKLRWAQQLSRYLSAQFRTQNTAALANETINLIGKMTALSTLWLGAQLVISSELSVGALIAFNMLAGRVAQPIQRLAQLWTQFQQIGVSMERMADVLNTRSEHHTGQREALPTVAGDICFEGITFRYGPGQPAVLQGFNLHILPGEVIGVTGRSGCGKSTLPRLLQRLYVPEQGRVLIDGQDISKLELTTLRHQVGVVMQDSTLFNMSIRQNIAINDSGAPLEDVIKAAKLAGAHEFILQLPRGYDTVVEEAGKSLSGGQRQRVAIARILFSNPRILVFDEATSALDAESEQVILKNMESICRGRTVLIIAHQDKALECARRLVSFD